MTGHWGPADLSPQISYEQFEKDGCPECGSKEGYLMFRSHERQIHQCQCGKTITVIYSRREQ